MLICFSLSGASSKLPDFAVAYFIQPRSITNDLTYRNSATFFQRFRGAASCSFFTFDSTFIYEKSRKTSRCCFKHDQDWRIAPLKLEHPDRLPKPSIVSWLPQTIFDLDCFCSGLWIDGACAFTHASYSLTNSHRFLQGNHVGIEDIQLRVGLRLNYCEDDMLSLYILGDIPSRHDHMNDSCEHHIGSRSGSLGGGFMYDSTWWYSEFSDAELLFMTEFKFLYRLQSSEWRLLPLKNSPSEAQDLPPASRLGFWRSWVSIDPRPTIEWWAALHYENCGWGAELAYNIWWRDREDISCSHPHPSKGSTLGTAVTKELITKGGSEALSHTFSGTAIFQGIVGDTPLSCSGGLRYEITDLKRPFFSLENWGIFLKFSVSC